MKKRILLISITGIIVIVTVVILCILCTSKRKSARYESYYEALCNNEITEDDIPQEDLLDFREWRDVRDCESRRLDSEVEEAMLVKYRYPEFREKAKEVMHGYPTKVEITSVKEPASVIVHATYKHYYITFVGNAEVVKGTIIKEDSDSYETVLEWLPE